MSGFAAISGKIAGVLSLIAFIPYVVAILRGQTKPNRATWCIWTAVGFLLGASYYSSGARETIWVPVSYAVGPLLIALLSIKLGEGGWTKFDKRCVIAAGIGVIAWVLTGSSVLALIIFLFIDLMGALPTIRKSYLEPESESRLAWSLFFAGNITNLFAVESWTFAIAAYPIYMFICSGLILGLLLFRPSGSRNTKPHNQ